MKKQFKRIVKKDDETKCHEGCDYFNYSECYRYGYFDIKVNKDDETKCHEECDYFSYSECYRYGYFDINEERMKRHKECINEMGMPSEEEENQ